MRRGRGMQSAPLLLVCAFILSAIAVPLLPPMPHRQPRQLSLVREFLALKSSRTSDSIWGYSGLIRNPLSGKEIAHIYGLEIVSPVNYEVNSSRTILQRLFSSPVNGTYISKKVFIYTDAANHSQPLAYFRMRPKAPKRPLSPVKTYYESVTVGYDAEKQSSFMRVCWPGGRLLKNNKMTVQEVYYAFPLSLFMRQFQIINFVKGKLRSRGFVSFAAEENSGRTQEYYTFRQMRLPFIRSSQLDYKRYGECPAWFSSGRLCSTELSARKYSSIRKLPPLIRRLVGENAPDFVSSRGLSESEFSSRSDLVSAFKPWYHRLNPFRAH